MRYSNGDCEVSNSRLETDEERRARHAARARKKKFYTVALFSLVGLICGLVGGLCYATTGLRGVWGIGLESLQQLLDMHPVSAYKNQRVRVRIGIASSSRPWSLVPAYLDSTFRTSSADDGEQDAGYDAGQDAGHSHGETQFQRQTGYGAPTDFWISSIFMASKTLCFIICV